MVTHVGYKSSAIPGIDLGMDIESDGSPTAPKSGPFNPQGGDLNRIPMQSLDDSSLDARNSKIEDGSRNGAFSAPSKRVQKIDRDVEAFINKIEELWRSQKTSNTERSVTFRTSSPENECKTWVPCRATLKRPPSITEEDCKTNSVQLKEKVTEAVRSIDGFRNILQQLNSEALRQDIPKKPNYQITTCRFHKPGKDFSKPSFEIFFINHQTAKEFVDKHNHKPLVVYPIGTLGVGVHVNLGGNVNTETEHLRKTLSRILGVDLSTEKASEIRLSNLLGGLNSGFKENELAAVGETVVSMSRDPSKFKDMDLPAVGETIVLPLKALQEPLEGRYVPAMKLSELVQLEPDLLAELSDRVNATPSDSWNLSDLPKIERHSRAEGKRSRTWELSDYSKIQEEQLKNLKV